MLHTSNGAKWHDACRIGLKDMGKHDNHTQYMQQHHLLDKKANEYHISKNWQSYNLDWVSQLNTDAIEDVQTAHNSLENKWIIIRSWYVKKGL